MFIKFLHYCIQPSKAGSILGKHRGRVFIRFRRKNSSEQEIRESLPKIYPRIWRYALVLTRDPSLANDLAQNTALRALEKADLYKTGTNLDRWLFTIAHRIWLNEVRAVAVRRAGGLVSLDSVEIPDSGNDAETNIFARQVFAKVQDLPEAQRETVLLVYIEGFSYKEAASVLDIPVGTVMSRLAAARKTLAHLDVEDMKVVG